MSDSSDLHVLVSGASGMLGTALLERLTGRARVTRLVRRPPAGEDEVRWDPDAGAVDAARLEGVDAVVHLAGANLAQRWTAASRAEIVRSRVRATRGLAEALAGLQRPPRVLVAASAVGVYGAQRGDAVLTEASEPGSDFIAELVQGWEAATEPAARAGIRVVNLRFGVVLSRRGGALARMLLPFRLGIGGRVGSGRQWMSWIALEDAVALIEAALRDARFQGAYNAAAGAVTNRDFTTALGRVLRRPTLLPVPVFALRRVFGSDMLDATLLASQRVQPARLQALGYRFAHPELEGALRAALAC